jgi:hypothetical protein
MKHCRLLMIVAALGLLAMCAPAVDSQRVPIALAVHFKLTDLDYKPLVGAPARIVFGSDSQWQKAPSGYRFVTDARGEHRFAADVRLDKGLRKIPTNFVDSLLSRPQTTDHLMVAAELEYMTYRWLYAIDVYRFPGSSDVLLDDASIYSRDAEGDFTRKAEQDKDGWRIADLEGMVLTTPGHQPWDFMLQPDPSDATGKRWTLELAFKRSPPPVRR